MNGPDYTREPGTITGFDSGDLSDGRGDLTTSLYINLKGAGQAFGGLSLGEKYLPDYVADLCATFGVTKPKELVGKKCFVLRNFNVMNEVIEGLESVDTGKRFVHATWRKKHFPTAKTPLESKRDSLLSEIESFKRRIERTTAELVEIDSTYVRWE
jgi:hypothetical protein